MSCLPVVITLIKEKIFIPNFPLSDRKLRCAVVDFFEHYEACDIWRTRSLTHFPLLENQVEDVAVVIMQKVGRNNIAMKGLMDGRGARRPLLPCNNTGLVGLGMIIAPLLFPR